MAEPIGETPGVNGELSKSSQPPEQPVQSPESPQQFMERRRDETKKSIDIIAASMIDLDEQKVEPRMRAINMLRDIGRKIGKLPKHPEIYDGLIIAEAHKLAGQLIAEIDRKRAERGEPPAETVFDPSHLTEATPITSNIDSIELI